MSSCGLSSMCAERGNSGVSSSSCKDICPVELEPHSMTSLNFIPLEACLQIQLQWGKRALAYDFLGGIIQFLTVSEGRGVENEMRLYNISINQWQ